MTQIQLDTYINVLQSHFMQSAKKIQDCPAQNCTEIAMLGRSNVGKSSIINLLLNHKLAKSSSTPGKTKLINFFKTTWEISTIRQDSTHCNKNETIKTQHKKDFINVGHTIESVTQNITDPTKNKQTSQKEAIRIPLIFIDFPGFGYAKVSKDTKKVWDKYLTDFIYRRQSIKLFCHLIDSRHTNLEIDEEISVFLKTITESRQDCKLLQIYTKYDKLSRNDFNKLKAQNKLTISAVKKTSQSIQQLYHAILYTSLNWDHYKHYC